MAGVHRALSGLSLEVDAGAPIVVRPQVTDELGRIPSRCSRRGQGVPARGGARPGRPGCGRGRSCSAAQRARARRADPGAVRPTRRRAGNDLALRGLPGRPRADHPEAPSRLSRSPRGEVPRPAELERAAAPRPRCLRRPDRRDEKQVLWDKAARLAVLAAVTSLDAPLDRRASRRSRVAPGDRGRDRRGVCVATADGVMLLPSSPVGDHRRDGYDLTTSTARDIEAGRPSELDAIAGLGRPRGRAPRRPVPGAGPSCYDRAAAQLV